LIRKYGYHGTDAALEMVGKNPDFGANLGAAAHLIHGSSEGRFRITWCPGHLTREEVEGVGFEFGELGKMMQLYDPAKLKQGWNCVQSEEIFFIENPGLACGPRKTASNLLESAKLQAIRRASRE